MSATVATAFAPASIGNLGVGFDVLGMAISGPGDSVTATRVGGQGITITNISGDGIGADAHLLSTDADGNTAGIAAASLWRAAGETGGLALELVKGTPLGSGMGSSAASAVAGVMAANALLAQPLPGAALLEHALTGEAYASKARHADNVAPSLFGGIVLCPPDLLSRHEMLPAIDGVCSVLVHPHLRVDTAAAREALGEAVLLKTAVAQMGLIAAFVHACHRWDRRLLAESLRDLMIEPQRERFVTGFRDVQSAAMAAGGYGCSLSGSGPSLFALCDARDADAVSAAMRGAFASRGIDSDTWVSPMHSPGARIVVQS